MSDTTTSKVGSKLMARISRRVEEFLTELGETDPNDLDGENLERASLEIAKELGLGLMEAVFRHADETAPEVTVNGGAWGNRQVTPGTYTVKYGTFTIDRSGYQQSGRGRAMFPVDMRLGVVEGRYSVGMARVMAHTIAEMPAEHGEAYLKELGLGVVSSSTLTRIPKDMAAVHEGDRVRIEGAVRREWHPPEGAHTVQAGMDGVMVAMDGEHAKPRGRPTKNPAQARHARHYGETAEGPADSDGKCAGYHEASVGTLSFFDENRECLGTLYIARMPEHRKETLVAQLEAELHAVLEDQPALQVALASDGALTHWEHLSGIQARLPDGVKSRQLLDFWHAAKYLFDAAKLVEDDEGAAHALAETWRASLRHRKDGADVVLRALRYQRDTCTDDDVREELDTIVEFFAEHRRTSRLAYKEATNEGFPIGTGNTEAAAKTVVNVRMKRAGARYDSHGGQTILTFRAALLSGRFDSTMREIINSYRADVLAA
jgi:hypothetical protein